MASKMDNFELFKNVNIIDSSGNKVDIETLNKTQVVGLYFSAHWCGPCQRFTPKLAKLYMECKSKNKSFEIVFVSSDQDAESHAMYFKEMPWTALDYEERDLEGTLSEIYSVEGIPSLVLLRGDGTEITRHGEDIISVGADFFPWDEASMEEGRKRKEAEEAARQKEVTAKMENFELLNTVSITDSSGNKVDIETLNKTQVVGLYFSAHWCPPCQGFTPKLAELYNECKSKNKSFEIVFVSSDQDAESHEEYFKEMPWTTLNYEERDFKNTLSEIYSIKGIPSLVLLRGDGTEITRSGRDIVSVGADFFPWDEAMMEKGREAAEERARKEVEE